MSLNGECEQSEEAREAIALVERIVAGDANAEHRLIELYEPGLRRVLRWRGVAQDDVQDLAHELWLKVLPKLRDDELRDRAMLASYLNGFARRVVSNYRRRVQNSPEQPLPDTYEPPDSEQDGPLARLDREQAIDIAGLVISELAVERDRVVLIRVLIEEVEADLVCQEVGVSREHLSRVLHRAKKRFIAHAKARFPEMWSD